MRILIAPDSFKGSVPATRAADAMAAGCREVFPDAETELFPMADGGEGTVDAVLRWPGSVRITVWTEDPLGRPIQAAYAWFPDRKTAVIETAAASGLPLLKGEALNPGLASTRGTGLLIRDALDRGAGKLVLGLGGSATVDAGTGLLEALGIRFRDEEGRIVSGRGENLGRIRRIERDSMDPRLRKTDMLLACDVINPLTGPEGAVRVYGPQKGVTPENMNRFEEGMIRWADLLSEMTGKDLRNEPGSGAAGGIAFSLRTLFDADMESGCTWLAREGRLEEKIARADLVLTGEGSFDAQSRYGKVPVSIGRMAKKHGTPVVVITGQSECFALPGEGIDMIMPITDRPMCLEEAMKQGETLIRRAAARIGAALKIGGSVALRKKRG
ncbi:glycerate kinase [Staphylospora marina]|uniref:glycerate kinase n=1 Tax=Staphylospora marina TaxID=2490858 RepID=UPI000F5BC7B3|nr:glycerate kinase [Staphylospora marina]